MSIQNNIKSLLQLKDNVSAVGLNKPKPTADKTINTVALTIFAGVGAYLLFRSLTDRITIPPAPEPDEPYKKFEPFAFFLSAIFDVDDFRDYFNFLTKYENITDFNTIRDRVSYILDEECIFINADDNGVPFQIFLYVDSEDNRSILCATEVDPDSKVHQLSSKFRAVDKAYIKKIISVMQSSKNSPWHLE